MLTLKELKAGKLYELTASINTSYDVEGSGGESCHHRKGELLVLLNVEEIVEEEPVAIRLKLLDQNGVVTYAHCYPRWSDPAYMRKAS